MLANGVWGPLYSPLKASMQMAFDVTAVKVSIFDFSRGGDFAFTLASPPKRKQRWIYTSVTQMQILSEQRPQRYLC